MAKSIVKPETFQYLKLYIYILTNFVYISIYQIYGNSMSYINLYAIVQNSLHWKWDSEPKVYCSIK